MRRILLYSLLLIAGLVVSQFLGGQWDRLITPLTMFALAFIMIHVGYEVEIDKARLGQYGWGIIALHVLAITVLSNAGKMFAAFCYRQEASLRERLAVSIAMFPRGEVGAGVLVVSLSYELGGPAITVAVLALALNLLCTGLFIVSVKKLLAQPKDQLKPRENHLAVASIGHQ